MPAGLAPPARPAMRRPGSGGPHRSFRPPSPAIRSPVATPRSRAPAVTTRAPPSVRSPSSPPATPATGTRTPARRRSRARRSIAPPVIAWTGSVRRPSRRRCTRRPAIRSRGACGRRVPALPCPGARPRRAGARGGRRRVSAGACRVLGLPLRSTCGALQPSRWPAGERLRACHSFEAFRPSAMDVAMHATFSFPLAGAHRAVACQLCHRELDRKPPVSTLLAAAATARPLRFDEKGKHCADCHASPHGDQFARRKDQGACESCHALEAFVPASRFDHDRDASFPLTGAHARAACAACHRAEPRTGKSPRVVYYPVSHRCESCHAGRAVPSLTSATGSTKP